MMEPLELPFASSDTVRSPPWATSTRGLQKSGAYRAGDTKEEGEKGGDKPEKEGWRW